MILPLLRQLGFTDNESEVYLAVLHSGKITAANAGKATGLNRTTVYSVAKALLKRGVIREDLGAPVAQLVAVPPAELRGLIDKEEAELKQKKRLMDDVIAQLEEVAKTTKYSIPKITFIAEEEVGRYLRTQTPVWNESIRKYDSTWWGFQAPSFAEAYEDWIDWYWQSPAHKGLELKMLSNEAGVEEKMVGKRYAGRQIRFWKDSEQFDSTLWVNGDHVVMIVTKAHPFYLVEIHDAVLAGNLREMFKGIWKATGAA